MNKHWILGAALVVGATTAGCAAQFSASDETRTLHVYNVIDSLSSTVAPADRPGLVGKMFGMCDADTYYVTYGDNAECVVLNGSLGDVRVTGLTIAPAEAARVADLVRREDQALGGKENSTRAILEDDHGPVAIVSLSDLRNGRAVAATELD
jgi:hypothetical protein